MMGLFEKKKEEEKQKGMGIIPPAEKTEMEKYEEKHGKGKASHEVIVALFTLQQAEEDIGMHREYLLREIKAGKYCEAEISLANLRHAITKKTITKADLVACAEICGGVK